MGEEVVEPVDLKVDFGTDVASFDPSKKKKKKKKKVVVQDPTSIQEEDSTIKVQEDHKEDHRDHEEGEATTSTLNHDYDREYTYEELIGRVFNMMRENNPKMVASGGRRVATLTLRPPEVLREGTKKTVLVNFMDFCKRMHREPEHVMSFLLVELGTTGSLDGQQRLVVKGRFYPNTFEGILRKYGNEYVTCGACRSSNTILSKEENRLMFVRCEQCGSARTVAAINKGVFLAQVQHRKNSRPRGS